MIRITLTSVFVDDQARTLACYTETLGFAKQHDVPVGAFPWLTVVSPAAPDGVELLLEPNDNPVARTYQAALYGQGLPAATFAVDDIGAEHARLTGLGVAFRMGPTPMGPGTVAVLDDTCGNFIQLIRR